MVSESKYFSKKELQCKCGCGKAKMDEEFMARLDLLRNTYANPITLNSAYRCPKHNKAQGGVDDSPHVHGIAVDIRCSGSEAHMLLDLIMELDFKGVGISQKGDHAKRFIHIDDKQEGTRPWIWSY